jgi:flagellar hook-length control protein FliK
MPGDGMAGAAQLSAGTNGVTDATPTPTLKVPAGVDTPEFGQGLADRVSWMVDNNLNGAKLQVNPPQLGPIEVRIAVQGNHAQVWLTSHSAVTRDALESSSPKLREMLGAQGFGQVSVDISQRSYQERSAFSQPYQWTPSASPSSSTAAVQSTASSLPRLSSGAVDAYA